MLALLLAVLQPLVCHAVHADWIYGRDLAAVVSSLAGMDPEAKLSLAPNPGQQRVFHIAELKRLALARHIEAEVTEDVCFSWEMAVPERSQMLAAMRLSLAGREARIELMDASLTAAPRGEIVFPLSGLNIGSQGPAFWRGYVRYTGSKQFPIWARVVVNVKEQHVVATGALQYGDVLSLDRLKVESYEGPLTRGKFLLDAKTYDGFLCKRSIAAGTALTEDMLEAPREVNLGDVVTAIVQTGAALLEVKGVAESNGRKGEIIQVRNPRSGRTFHGRVTDKEMVVVVPGGQFGLVVEGRKS